MANGIALTQDMTIAVPKDRWSDSAVRKRFLDIFKPKVDILLMKLGYNFTYKEVYKELSEIARMAIDTGNLTLRQINGKMRVGYLHNGVSVKIPSVMTIELSKKDGIYIVPILNLAPYFIRDITIAKNEQKNIGGFVEITSYVNNAVLFNDAYVIGNSSVENCVVKGVTLDHVKISGYAVYPKDTNIVHYWRRPPEKAENGKR